MLSVAFSSAAWAGLGGVVVKSNLGEPLRAEIELSGSDGDVQRVGLATLDTFRELKVDYAPLLSSLRFTLAQRANGRPYIRVTSLAPISEPYLRFVVEAKMPSSRSVREYTVLLDPVDYALPANPAPAPVAARPPSERLAPAPRLPPPPRIEREAVNRAPPDRISVRSGQTLHQLAASLALPNVSLRQVMAALLEANPQAFVAGNPDQLRAGARLKVPPLSQIRALGRERSNSLLAAGRISQATTAAPVAAAVTAAPAVAPAKPAAAAEQLVKLEPVTAPASAPAVDASAVVSEQALQLQQAQQKITELEKRLNALQAAATPQPAPAAEERGEPLLDQVMAYLPLIGGALAAVLLGLAAIIMLRRRRAAGTGHVGAASTLRKQSLHQPNTEPMTAGNTFLTDFTRSGTGGAEAGDVDPIAEAEVYLAYGRDQQAEEILKEALAKDPTLHEVRAKLLEIYASRQDRAAFEPHARALHDALGGQGTLWDKIAKLGRGIDPANALYGGVAVAGEAVADSAFVASPMDIDLDNELMGSVPAAAAAEAEPVAPAVDDDPLRAALLGDDPFAVDAPPKALAPELDIESLLASAEQVVAEPAPVEPEPEENKHMLDFDFQLDEPVSAGSPLETLAAAEPDANSVDFDFGLDSLGTETPAVSTEGMSVSDDPLSTKLDLARVYLDMGDKDGAREVLEELVAEAGGSLKQEAANLLSSL
ncbi:FimV/HubP family polar landmark protein [Vogesella indigofera]|uniref:FimV/HubP family polar landmark protein n=1 Tax=Vogesella indigofera TaxID=45465 RepID=UPI003F443D5A